MKDTAKLSRKYISKKLKQTRTVHWSRQQLRIRKARSLVHCCPSSQSTSENRNTHCAAPKLCNRTGLIVETFMLHAFKAAIMTDSKWKGVFIPRILLMPLDMSFRFRCPQFPRTKCCPMKDSTSLAQYFRFVGFVLKRLCVNQISTMLHAHMLAQADSFRILIIGEGILST
ncbi:uncharacterized protein LOC106882283 [Octopus bimaculoides]|uniref:Uncharacterized protein n=1 Tax=Octopus bimaculoides TaxID=37653 RepID=A0A0L8FN41_OCTBM|nr:uncharacterized protein LOC106882283 [Octopus bimaculoides]|eukprot:XP_014788388.1 PREDICTED: uncharacterized protein LOC106882283 [Octopus bimaculoides]